MVTVIAVTEEDDAHRVTLTTSEETENGDRKRVFRVPERVYAEIDFPGVGCVLSTDQVAALIASGARTDAVERALRILAFGDNNRASLYKKLRSRGHDDDAATYAVDYACAHGYIDEKEQIRRRAAALADTKLWGRRKITLYLLAHAYRREDIDEAIDALVRAGDVDFDANFERLVGKCAETDEDRAKLRYKYGY